MLSLRKNLIAMAALAALFVAPNAFAIPGMSLGVMGGGTFASTNQVGLNTGFGISGGASLGLGPVELSALYSQYKLSGTVLGVAVSSTSNFLDIPVLYRLGLGPISLGVGGFYSLFLNGSSTAAGITTNVTNGDSNYGATGSVRFTLPVVGFFADARYNLGLKDNAGSKISSIAAYVGWNFL